MKTNIGYLDRAVDLYTEKSGFSGVIRVTAENSVLYERTVGYADWEEQTPFSPDSLFTFYSLSKPFCAMGLLRLYEKGLVRLNAHPSLYVPEAELFPRDVTLHTLLNHSAGIPDFVQTQAFYEEYGKSSLSVREQLCLLSHYPPFFKAGTDTRYTNVNFLLLALVIENVSGKTYADYMRDEVFAPLSMQTAMVDREGLCVPHRVSGYEKTERGEIKRADKDYYSMFGAGDILGTVSDVYALRHAIRDRLLLKEDTWDKILTPHPVSTFGYGCRRFPWHGKDRITHNGGSAGFRTLHVYLPNEDFDIILLSNSGWGDARDIITEEIHTAFFGDDGTCHTPLDMDKGYI